MVSSRRLSWLASVTGTLAVVAACSSSSSSATGGVALSGINLTGWYKSTSSGTIGEITFLSGSAYMLTRSDCVLSSTGKPTVIDATTTLPVVAGVDPSAVEYCVESGTSTVDAAAGTLVLKNAATGASTSMPLAVTGSPASSSAALNGTTLKLQGAALGGEGGTSLTGPSSSLALGCESLISGVNLGLQQFVPVAPPTPKAGWSGCTPVQEVNPMGQLLYSDKNGDATTSTTDSKGRSYPPLMEGWQHVQNPSGQFYLTSFGCNHSIPVSSEYGGLTIDPTTTRGQLLSRTRRAQGGRREVPGLQRRDRLGQLRVLERGGHGDDGDPGAPV